MTPSTAVAPDTAVIVTARRRRPATRSPCLRTALACFSIALPCSRLTFEPEPLAAAYASATSSPCSTSALTRSVRRATSDSATRPRYADNAA